jgi:spermidine/putrescine transport system substrate-binding protein
MGPVSSRQRLSRRVFLQRAGLGAAGVAIGGPALLAACSGSSSSASGPREVRLYDEPVSLDDLSPDLFEKGTGIFLRLHEYTDPAQYLEGVSGRLRAHRDIGADVVVIRDFETARMIESGWVRPVQSAANRRRILPAFAAPHFDPERRFSLPWASTVVGLAYDRRTVLEPIRSAGALFDPRFAGKVALSAHSGSTLGLTVLASGGKPATVTESQAGAAVERVRSAAASGQVRSFATTEYIDDLVTGRASIAIARAADIREALKIYPSLAFVVPTEGGLLESTNMVVPTGAHNLDEARAFIDFMFKPLPIARIASYGSRVTTIKGGLDELRQVDVKASFDPLIEPDPATWARLSIWGLPTTSSAVSDFAAIVGSHANQTRS